MGRSIATLPAGFTESSSVESVTVRKTPGWAIVVGILGLLVFLIGVLFFFIETNVQSDVELRRYESSVGSLVVRPGTRAEVT